MSDTDGHEHGPLWTVVSAGSRVSKHHKMRP